MPRSDTCMVPLVTPGRGPVLIDAADLPLVAPFHWFFTGHRYAARQQCGGVIYMHRMLLRAEPGLEVDHINGDGLDNRRCNLRTASAAQNQWNGR